MQALHLLCCFRVRFDGALCTHSEYAALYICHIPMHLDNSHITDELYGCSSSTPCSIHNALSACSHGTALLFHSGRQLRRRLHNGLHNGCIASLLHLFPKACHISYILLLCACPHNGGTACHDLFPARRLQNLLLASNHRCDTLAKVANLQTETASPAPASHPSLWPNRSAHFSNACQQQLRDCLPRLAEHLPRKLPQQKNILPHADARECHITSLP